MTNKALTYLGMALLVALGGCAVTQPEIDLATLDDPIAFQKDLLECNGLARIGGELDAQNHIVGSGAKAGITGGAEGLLLGMVAGFFTAPIEAEQDRAHATATCLAGRGYALVNAATFRLTIESRCQAIHGRYGWWGDYEGCLKQ